MWFASTSTIVARDNRRKRQSSQRGHCRKIILWYIYSTSAPNHVSVDTFYTSATQCYSRASSARNLLCKSLKIMPKNLTAIHFMSFLTCQEDLQMCQWVVNHSHSSSCEKVTGHFGSADFLVFGHAVWHALSVLHDNSYARGLSWYVWWTKLGFTGQERLFHDTPDECCWSKQLDDCDLCE